MKVKITRIRKYNELNEILQIENLSKLVPNITAKQIKKIE